MILAIVFCSKCGSHHVDVRGWTSPTTATIACSDCQHVGRLEGFTIGRFLGEDDGLYAVEEVLAKAKRDRATPGHIAG